MKTFKLKVVAGEQAGAEFTLKEGENLIGRSRSTAVRLTAPDVSSRHARLILKTGVATVANLSQFGTYINEVAVPGGETVSLQAGQILKIGSTQLQLLEEKPRAELTAGQEQNTAARTVEPRDDATRRGKPAGAIQAIREAPPPEATLTHGGISQDFDQTMRAMAEAADLSQDGADDDSSDKTNVQKTVFAPKEELERRLDAERKKDRQRQLAYLGGGILLIVLLFVCWPKPDTERKIEFDQTYDIGEYPAPLGGFKLLYPKNGTSKAQAVSDGVMVNTHIGHKRDVSLTIRLQESANDKWAVQEPKASLREWMGSHPELTFGTLREKFEGDQNGIRVYSLPYTRTGDKMVVGEVRVFFHGRRLEAIFSEVGSADQVRAENMFRGCTYFEWDASFEFANWCGQKVNGETGTTGGLAQIAEDLGREAPLTWASIAQQLQEQLTRSVQGKRPELEDQALRLLSGLRQQQARWYNSQHLIYLNTLHAGDQGALREIIQRAQAVFADQADSRFFEVRKW
jgi:pSer/pThr/pTyr-binding forkhead associated (FHA) protein